MDYLELKLNFHKIFNKEAKLPETPQECIPWFKELSADLSPENLACDGELSANQVKIKKANLMKAWRRLEEIYGKKVNPNSLMN